MHPITELLGEFDKAYELKFRKRAPIVRGKDSKLAQALLQRYSPEDLAVWVRKFFVMDDAFIVRSGYTFGVFSACIGKVIAASVNSARPEPPVPLVELAKSIARANTEDAERGQQQLRAREQELIAQGISAPHAIIQASREWLKRQ